MGALETETHGLRTEDDRFFFPFLALGLKIGSHGSKESALLNKRFMMVYGRLL